MLLTIETHCIRLTLRLVFLLTSNTRIFFVVYSWVSTVNMTSAMHIVPVLPFTTEAVS